MYSIASMKTAAAAGNAARKSTCFQESPQDEKNSSFEEDALSIILFKNLSKK
jgi:hypothetical protein